ncbi:hypothetical protein EK904_000987 [Melospiza melodia maxima]|nr:hypothetical protein EK904_000987 [Melospiza melodia maxima]
MAARGVVNIVDIVDETWVQTQHPVVATAMSPALRSGTWQDWVGGDPEASCLGRQKKKLSTDSLRRGRLK